MLHHSIGDVGDGHLGSWGYQQGGMGAVSAACRRAAESFGAEIRTKARVRKILTAGGRFIGVALENGEELRAPVGVTAIHPKIAFLDLIERSELPPSFVWDIERWKTRSGVVKINVAISELPDFIADPGTNQQDHHTGSVELCFSPQYAEEAFQDAHMRHQASTRPFVDGVIPTTMDKELMPEGVHFFSMYTQWAPHEWRAEPHRKELEDYADRIFDIYNELAPNFKASVIDRQIIGPYDMEKDVGLIGGNIFHGELSVDQLFHMRPAPGYADYRTPIHGLYHGSSATHAGGGVCGIPGWQAFRQAKKDKAVAARKQP
jgi:phytoene dehydrogenase-like protein